MWELQKNQDGISVYTKPVLVSEGNEQLAYKGVTVVKASIDRLLEVMKDVNNFDKWIHNCYEAKVLQTVNDNERIVYQKTHFPWPTQDRDSILKQTFVRESASLIRLNMVNHDGAKNDDFIRIPYFNGYWSFKDLGNGKIEIVYEAVADSGGSIPSFIGDRFIVDVPFYSIKGLVEYL